MRTMILTLMAAGLSAGGLALAAPAEADCAGGGNGGFTPWGGSSYCDGSPYEDGSYDHCVTTIVLGFGGMQCNRVCPPDPANPGVTLPWTPGVARPFCLPPQPP
jgi:hypothetical protein